MNYEQMLSRLEQGLTIIEGVQGDLDVIAHAYIVAVPAATYSAYSEAQVETLIKDLGWVWSDEMGWLFSCLG